MVRIRSLHSRHLHRGRAAGQSLPLIGLMILVLVAMVGLSVDVGNTFAEERQAVSASNAASLAGMDAYIKRNSFTTNRNVYDAIVNSLSSNGIQVAAPGTNPQNGQLILNATYLNSEGQPIDTGSPVITNDNNAVPTNVAYVQVALEGRVDTFFARVVNRPDLPINATSYAGTCPANSGVYPLAVASSNINGDEFADPGPVAPGQDPIFQRIDSGTYAGYTMRRLFVKEENTPGSFSWLRWMDGTGAGGSNSNSSRELALSLTGTGNLGAGFDEVTPWPLQNTAGAGILEPEVYPEEPGTLSVGDWIHGSSGWSNGSGGNDNGVNAAIQDHIANQTRLILPIYDATAGQGSNAAFHVSRLGLFVIVGTGREPQQGPYFDMIFLGDPDRQETACTVTPPAPNDASCCEVWGPVQLWPEYQIIPQERKPIQYVVVLDVSGSMSANFDGLCNNNGTVQCANGPPGSPAVTVSNTGPSWFWTTESERRIYVAKQSIIRLAQLANMPGNSGYDSTRPPDQMALVWFRHQVPAGNTAPFSSDVNTIRTSVLNAGRYNNNSYRTEGGTNGAAGLYRGSLLLENAPRQVSQNGRTWEYKRVVIFITDGVSNQFLNRNATNLHLRSSDANTYPNGHQCRSGNVSENAPCQTTEIGGIYRSGNTNYDRPITQMIDVSSNDIRGNPDVNAEVFTLALSNIPETGLRDGVASFPRYHYTIPTLETYGDGTTNVDRVMEFINTTVEGSLCTPGANNEWQGTISAGEFVVPPGAMTLSYPNVGLVTLTDGNTGATYETPIVAATDGSLTYRFDRVPRGTYRLEASLYYRHPLDPPSAPARVYSQIYNGSTSASDISLNVGPSSQAGGFSQSVRQDLQLRFGGDICSN